MWESGDIDFEKYIPNYNQLSYQISRDLNIKIASPLGVGISGPGPFQDHEKAHAFFRSK